MEARESRESSCCRPRWRGRARNWLEARACASSRAHPVSSPGAGEPHRWVQRSAVAFPQPNDSGG